MTAITDSRKRSREEDGSDFMPLSKRITNLHINQSSSPMQSENDIADYNMNVNHHHHQQQQQQQQHHQSIQQHQSLQFQNQFGSFGQMPSGESNQFSDFSNLSHPIDEQERQYRQYLSECNNASSSNGSSCTNVSSNENHMASYDPYEPELSQEQNPFYYTKNKLLYDLYLERLRRHQ
ncbi:hypothetical protein HA402_015101 [Bradysia odoriphaga]|nr:hypothetical protein HA402_015101 [Bradysia odoriphaga]